VGQVGSSPLTTAVGKKISLQVHQYASESDLVQAANQTKIYGGFIAQSNTLIISEAASLCAPGIMPAA
jgi:phenylalanine-4-hydroxylase